MNVFRKFAACSTLALTFAVTGAALAQHDDHHDNNHFQKHDDWKAGHKMAPADWQRGDRVDYKQRHLPPPRSGYEWRQVDGNYVMAAVATGVIASVIVASTVH